MCCFHPSSAHTLGSEPDPAPSTLWHQHNMEKTDKTMTELEIEADMSLTAEWDTSQESKEKLTPLFGAECTGTGKVH